MKFLIFSMLFALNVHAQEVVVPVVMETSMGTIEIDLYESKAPRTVANFLKYVDEKFYDGTIFHRVMSTFMIQGGGFTKGMKEKPTHEAIRHEGAGTGTQLSNDVGVLAMARTNDPHSATAQFFINVENNRRLDHNGPTPSGWGYVTFGKVTNGMDVVNKIKMVPTGTSNGHENVPVKPVTIISIKRKQK